MGKDLKSKLRARKLSLQKWALKHGYVPRTVHITAQRWWDRTDRAPHGGLARQIMADLRRDLDE